jgi:hypothetical protein
VSSQYGRGGGAGSASWTERMSVCVGAASCLGYLLGREGVSVQ